MKIALIVLSFFLMLGCSLPLKNDFDIVCGYFDNLQVAMLDQEFSKSDRVNFIENEINKGLPSNSSARVAWEAIINAVSWQRYGLYKEAAESVLSAEWHCRSMEKLIVTMD